jgi:outer membrane protein assembly factor BamB
MIVEMGAKPRLREVAPDGKIAVEIALQPETSNTHMQTRMARKLANGNYLCPHLLAFAIKEYKPDGTVVRTIKTDLPELGGREKRNWPFTAIVLKNGNIMANLTNGNKTVEFTPDGKVAWVATNDHVAGRFADPCGGQVLPNGNVVITSYGQRSPTKTKLFELNKKKEVVWEYIDPRYRSAHGIHILTTNGEPVKPAMK